ncbi:MAG: extracellular solute-binding protein [Chloroflexi bacterium]|nr:extracellular solute-binding protein [Chloroflexota bacterium]
MKHRILGAGTALTLLIVACTPAAPAAPTTAPTVAPAAAKPTDVPKPAALAATSAAPASGTTAAAPATAASPAAAAAAKPTTATAPAAPGLSAAEWDQIVAAAKKEGKVSVIGPQGADSRDALAAGFSKKYPEIQVDFNGLAGNQTGPKVLTELAANQNSTDLIVTGTTTALETLLPANALDPIPPLLVGPNVRDQSVWLGNKLSFADSQQKYNLIFSGYVKAPFIYNPDLVKPEEFTSYRDLLDPKWKGKIVVRDPRTAGGGLAVITFMYATESLGKDYLRQLFKQDIVISSNDQQILDWVARGQYPIVLGPSDTLTNEYINKGLPVRHMDSSRMKEGAYYTAGNGSLVAVRNAPHPNASKVYLDYMLSKEGQVEWGKSQGFASLRKDVPTEGILPLLIPKEGVTYQQNSSEPYVKLRAEIVEYLKTVIP